MAELLNEIIEIGGTTAKTEPVDKEILLDWMTAWPGKSVWNIACNSDGRVAGFQFAEPHPDLPSDTADIATFVRIGETGNGIGRRLFNATSDGVLALGYKSIVAVIRADNVNGLAYYNARGFENYDRLTGVTLGNGLVVDKICKRRRLA